MGKILIKNAAAIEKMRAAGKVASEVLQGVMAAVKPGMTSAELDRYCGELIAEAGAKSAFLGYRGFPAQACISVNEQVVHGIGNDYAFQEGDVVSIDVGVVKDGWIGDNASTVPVGKISEELKGLLLATEASLYAAIEQVKDGVRLAEVCGAVEDTVKPLGYGIVRDFVGHGVGKDLHEEPQIPNYRPKGVTPRLKEGMILAIEPMVNLGTGKIRMLEDGWTVVTADGKGSAHFEHTVLVTRHGAEILTPRPRLVID